MLKFLIFGLLIFLLYSLLSSTNLQQDRKQRNIMMAAASAPSSSCNYLKSLGYFSQGNEATEQMCLKYFNACGDPSGTALAYNNLLTRRGKNPANPGSNPATFDDMYAAQLLYENADPSIPGNYCEEPLPCGSSCSGNWPPDPSCECPSGLPFTCKDFNTIPGQVSPGCY
jgi:hypothetical protein